MPLGKKTKRTFNQLLLRGYNLKFEITLADCEIEAVEHLSKSMGLSQGDYIKMLIHRDAVHQELWMDVGGGNILLPAKMADNVEFNFEFEPVPTKKTIPENINWAKDWRNITFEDSVRVIGFARGRSAANIRVKSTSKNEFFTIFLTDFFDMLKNGDVVDMIISGTFEVKKRGRNFGVRLKGVPEYKEVTPFDPDSRHPIPEYI